MNFERRGGASVSVVVFRVINGDPYIVAGELVDEEASILSIRNSLYLPMGTSIS